MIIHNDEELEYAGKLLDKLWHVKPGQQGYEDREDLVEAITTYEDEHVHIGPPDPITAIKFRMEHSGITPDDLISIGIFNSINHLVAVLSKKQELTKEIIFKLHIKLEIPLRSLLDDIDGVTLSEFVRMERQKLDKFEREWKRNSEKTDDLIQECSDDWLDKYECWKQQKFIDKE